MHVWNDCKVVSENPVHLHSFIKIPGKSSLSKILVFIEKSFILTTRYEFVDIQR